MSGSQLSRARESLWYEIFENDERADGWADEVRIAAIDSRFSRPDWNILVTPMILDAEDICRLHGRLSRLRILLNELARSTFASEGAAFLSRIGMPPETATALDLPGKGLFPCRWDVLETAQGWRAVEINATGALGVFATDAAQGKYDAIAAELGLSGTEGWTSLSRVVGATVGELAIETGAESIVVLVDSCTRGEYLPIARGVEEMLTRTTGLETSIADEREVLGKCYRNLPLLAYQCSAVSDRSVEPGRYVAFDEAVRAGRIIPIIDHWVDVVANKAMLAIAWERSDAGLLDSQDTGLLRDLVPRTLFLTGANRDAVIADRAAWVLKTAVGHGGYQVKCGWEMTGRDWTSALDAVAADYGVVALLQQRVIGLDRRGIGLTPGGDFLFMSAPQLLGLFQERQNFAGACSRQSPHAGGVVSVGSGAALGVVRTLDSATTR